MRAVWRDKGSRKTRALRALCVCVHSPCAHEAGGVWGALSSCHSRGWGRGCGGDKRKQQIPAATGAAQGPCACVPEVRMCIPERLRQRPPAGPPQPRPLTLALHLSLTVCVSLCTVCVVCTQRVIELGAGGSFTPTCLTHPDTYLHKVLVGGDVSGGGGSGGGVGPLQLWNYRTGQLLFSFKGWWVGAPARGRERWREAGRGKGWREGRRAVFSVPSENPLRRGRCMVGDRVHPCEPSMHDGVGSG